MATRTLRAAGLRARVLRSVRNPPGRHGHTTLTQGPASREVEVGHVRCMLSAYGPVGNPASPAGCPALWPGPTVAHLLPPLALPAGPRAPCHARSRRPDAAHAQTTRLAGAQHAWPRHLAATARSPFPTPTSKPPFTSPPPRRLAGHPGPDLPPGQPSRWRPRQVRQRGAGGGQPGKGSNLYALQQGGFGSPRGGGCAAPGFFAAACVR